jgi:hypothetical protein
MDDLPHSSEFVIGKALYTKVNYASPAEEHSVDTSIAHINAMEARPSM